MPIHCQREPTSCPLRPFSHPCSGPWGLLVLRAAKVIFGCEASLHPVDHEPEPCLNGPRCGPPGLFVARLACRCMYNYRSDLDLKLYGACASKLDGPHGGSVAETNNVVRECDAWLTCCACSAKPCGSIACP